MARRLTWLIALAVVFAAASPGYGQATTGTVAGRVVDSQGLAVPGAAVVVSGPQGTRVVATDEQGTFNVPFLPPGSGYAVRVELQGFKTVERGNVDVRLGQTVELTLTLEVGGTTETVNVTATSPLVDLTSTTTGARLDSEFLRGIPIGRRFSDTLFIAPGVSSGGATGDANPSFSGGSGLENLYLVDGVNISNTGYGALGSYSIVFGSLGNGLPFDFMEEVQVKTGGYEPEFGESTGGITNVVTKSGSNALHGSGFGYLRPTGLQADYSQIASVNGTVNTTELEQWDVGAEVGGPVIKDKVFFFGAIDPTSETRTLIAPDDVENFPLRALGEVDRERTILNYAAKGTWQLNSQHRIDASFYGDPGNADLGPQRGNALLGQDTFRFSEINEFGGHNQTVRWDGVINPSWYAEASFARAQNDIVETPSVNEPAFTDRTVTPNRVLGGIGFFEDFTGDNKQYQVKSTYLFHAGGSHELKGGLSFEDISFDRITNRTGQPVTLSDGQQTVTGASGEILRDAVFGEIVRATRGNLVNVTNSTQDYLTLFAQDTWRVGNRLTISGGLRWDRQKLEGALDEFTWDENFAPRIGGTFDPTGTGKAKLFANWGRFYAKIPNDIAIRSLSADAGITRQDFFDRALTQPIPDGVVTQQVNSDGTLGQPVTRHLLFAGLEPAAFDPDMNGFSQDELVVGGEYEVLPGLNVGGRYINRRLNDVVEDIGTAPLVSFLVPGAADSVEFFVTNPGPDSPVIPFQGFEISHAEPTRDYDAVEVFADKRFGDNWRLQASYRWSRLEGNFEGFFRNDNGQSDPGITSLFDFPTNDPSFTALASQFDLRGDIRFLADENGILPNDRRHQFKAFGNYLFPFRLNVGAGFIANSGAPLTPLASNAVFGNAGEIPEAPRGSGFQTVDGFRTRTETEYNVDLHADYGFPLPGGRRITAIVDLFNLFNIDRVLTYDPRTELGAGGPANVNPDFGAGGVDPSQALARVQSPFQARIGVRFEF